MAVANGNQVSIIDLSEKGKIVQSLHAHQKQVMQVRYEKNKNRLITGGND